MVQTIRIFVSHPSDVATEAEAVARVAADVSTTLALFGVPYAYIVSTWKTSGRPGPHTEGVQALLDEQLDYTSFDLLIAIFWKRFGTPTHRAASGTEHEIRKAIEAWKNTGSPEVMVYFKGGPYPISDVDESAQLNLVMRFRQELQEQNALVWEVKDVYHFEQDLRNHLLRDATERHQRQMQFNVTNRTVPNVVRKEGLSERCADILLDVDAKSQVVDVYVFTNVNQTTPIASRTNASRTNDETKVMAKLIIETRGSHFPANEHQGELLYNTANEVLHNAIVFYNVMIPASSISFHSLVRITITGVRCNATQLPTGTPHRESISAYVGFWKAGSFWTATQVAGAGCVVSNVTIGADSFFRDIWDGRQIPKTLRLRSPEHASERIVGRLNTAFLIHYREGFLGAYTTTAEEHATVAYINAPGNRHGMRFVLRLFGIAAGVEIYVSLGNLDWTEQNSLILGDRATSLVNWAPDYSLGFPSSAHAELPGVPFAVRKLEVAGGGATAVWLWTGTSGRDVNLSDILFAIVFDITDQAQPCQIDAVACLGPLNEVATSSFLAPAPRFTDRDCSESRLLILT